MATTKTQSNTGYVMESEHETQRLASQHEVIKEAMGGLILAEINASAAPLRILDSATADGRWSATRQRSR